MNPLSTRPNRWRPITVLNLLVGLLFSLSVMAQPAFLKEGLVAYYPFNGNANDESGNGNNIKSKLNQYSVNRFKNSNESALFVGGEILELSGGVKQISPTTSQFMTISFWAPKLSKGWVISQYYNGDVSGSMFFVLMEGDGGVRISGNGTSYGVLDGESGGENFWKHYVVVFRAGQNASTIYADGLRKKDITLNFNDEIATTPVLIGNLASATSTFFIGSLDDLRIYNRAFSDTEVKALYDYESAPQQINPRIATATAQVVNGFVVGATITDGGYGYVENPTVTITGGGGTGAKATATQINGVVTSITINNSGSGYTSTPTITIAPPPFPPRKATSTADIVNGFVVGAKIADGGFGYDTAPTVLLIGGGGSGATATATVVNGMVTAITIINSGSGYTSAPSIQIASPPFAPSLAIEVSRVSVRLKVVLGRKYQLEASTDLKTWTPTGPAFVAQAEELAQEFDVNQVGRYFRINQVP